MALTNGTQYSFAVSAVNTTGESGLSAVVTVTLAPMAPVISSVVGGDGNVTVSWEPVSGALSYNLYYQAGTTIDKTSGTELTGVSSPKVVSGLTNGIKYTFAMSTMTVAGESGLSTILSTTPASTVTDIDGNVYHTVTIGSQVWMVENLKTTKFNDGTAIPLVTDAATWGNITSPRYCWYNNNSSTNSALYNWYAVRAGIAPVGWHVPTDSEWSILTTYLGGENLAGGKLKEAGLAHWDAPNTGATNETGFSAIPGGSREWNGPFLSLYSSGWWWTSSSSSDGSFAWDRYMAANDAAVHRNFSYNMGNGLSVRCIRD
jgi:uncharacterized protein (TIGR02145 family)